MYRWRRTVRPSDDVIIVHNYVNRSVDQSKVTNPRVEGRDFLLNREKWIWRKSERRQRPTIPVIKTAGRQPDARPVYLGSATNGAHHRFRCIISAQRKKNAYKWTKDIIFVNGRRTNIHTYELMSVKCDRLNNGRSLRSGSDYLRNSFMGCQSSVHNWLGRSRCGQCVRCAMGKRLSVFGRDIR
jgi:hypothetical protein